MANEEFGPLAGLIGTWFGDEGVNVSFDYDVKKIIETPYTGTVTWIEKESWRYEENTVMTMTATGNTMDHTDSIRLRKVTASMGS